MGEGRGAPGGPRGAGGRPSRARWLAGAALLALGAGAAVAGRPLYWAAYSRAHAMHDTADVEQASAGSLLKYLKTRGWGESSAAGAAAGSKAPAGTQSPAAAAAGGMAESELADWQKRLEQREAEMAKRESKLGGGG